MALVWGAEYIYQPNLVQHQYCCRMGNNKIVNIYRDMGAGGGVAVVGTIAGNAITWGVPSQHTVGGWTGARQCVCPIDDDKFIVVFGDNGVGNFGFARVGVVTGTNIAWGPAVQFVAARCCCPSCCQLGTDKFAIAFTNSTIWDSFVVVGTVVGDVITLGGPVSFYGFGSETNSCIAWDTDKFLLAYYDRANNGVLQVVTAVGLVPTCHATVNFETGTPSAQFESGLAKVDTDKFAISWRRGAGGADPNNAHCVRMGSVAGNIITLGTYYVLNPFPENTDQIGVEALTVNPNQFAVLYKNHAGPLGHGTWNVLDFTGTTITNFGAKQYFKASAINHLATTNLLNGKLAVVFQDVVPVTGDGMIGTFLNLPTVTTDPATGVTLHTATLNGILNNDGGEACDCGFEWGLTVAYGNTTPTQSRTSGQTFSQFITTLRQNSTYYFRAFAINTAGKSYGAHRTFKTLRTSVGTLVLTLPATGVT